MAPGNRRNLPQKVSGLDLEFRLAFRLKIAESETVRKCVEMKRDLLVKYHQNCGRQQSIETYQD